MSKIIIENTREHDITVNATNSAGGTRSITIPSARQSPSDKSVLLNGRADVDEEFIDAAKKSPVIAHYFEAGWLRIARRSPPVAAPNHDKGQPNKGQPNKGQVSEE